MSGTPATRDYSEERTRALHAALQLYDTGTYQELATRIGGSPADANAALTATASAIFTWLTGPAILLLAVGPVLSQDTGLPVDNPLGGNPMQLRDNEQVDLTVTLASSRGNVISDQPGTQDDLTWTVEGSDGVVTLDVSEDTRTATVKAAGPVGSAVVRVEVSGGELFATEAFDVVPGDVALVTITAGEVTEQDSGTGEPTPGEGEPTPGEPTPGA